MFGYAEHVVTEPLGPKDLVKIIYDMCMPADPIEAVLQQEVGVATESCDSTRWSRDRVM